MATAGRGARRGHVTNLTSPSRQFPTSQSLQPAGRAAGPWRKVIKLGVSPAPAGSRQVLSEGSHGKSTPSGKISAPFQLSACSQPMPEPRAGALHCPTETRVAPQLLPSFLHSPLLLLKGQPPTNVLSSYLGDEPMVLAQLWSLVPGAGRRCSWRVLQHSSLAPGARM